MSRGAGKCPIMLGDRQEDAAMRIQRLHISDNAEHWLLRCHLRVRRVYDARDHSNDLKHRQYRLLADSARRIAWLLGQRLFCGRSDSFSESRDICTANPQFCCSARNFGKFRGVVRAIYACDIRNSSDSNIVGARNAWRPGSLPASCR